MALIDIKITVMATVPCWSFFVKDSIDPAGAK